MLNPFTHLWRGISPATKKAVTTTATAMVVAAAAPIVMHFEGLKLKAYLDPVGIPTACYGTTLGIRIGMIFTKEECDAQLKENLTEAVLSVDRLTEGKLGLYQRAAFGSFVYNVGAGAFAQSTALKLIRAGDIEGACRQLDRWVYAKGQKLNGLVRRREAEMELCLRGL